MTLTDIPLLAVLKSKLGYVNQRQTVIAQNVANADTPGYEPKDLKAFHADLGDPFSVQLSAPRGGSGLGSAGGSGALAEARTNAMHMQLEAPSTPSKIDSQIKNDSEVRLDGNHVVLEDQMVKLSAARMDYDAAVGFYQQSLNLVKMALKKPGS